jgi:outer membrane receptor protein involved in Fe transport
LSYRDGPTDVNLSFTGANNTLNGGQTLPQSFLNENREQAYTFPDTFGNQLSFFNLDGKHSLTTDDVLGGNVYYRSLRQRNFSTNVNDDFDPTSAVGPGNFEAQNVQDNATTEGYGAGVQYSHLGKIGGRNNQFTIGASVDAAETDFSEAHQDANFAPDRSNIVQDDFSTVTQVRTTNQYYGIYATDTFSITQRLDLTLAGRYNRAEVKITDQTGLNSDLNGKSTFNRFNPAAGLTFKPSDTLTTYVSYNEGMRIATPVELTCADPAAPCALPNEFLADPPLKPVIARTFEIGARGHFSSNLRWRATAYQTRLQDDIQFISASAGSPNTGFFQNVGDTRRRGFELGLDGRKGAFNWFASYAFIDATFQTAFTEHSPANSLADANGDIQVQPGNELPGIPRNIFKARLEYAFAQKWSIGASMYAATSQFARGDENNQDANGKVKGYTIFNLDARWEFARAWELFAEVDNLFNTKYNTLGVLGANFFNGPGHTFDANNPVNELFLSPGAPLGAWVGIRYSFGGRATH